jgi:glycerophosphoryl diester phosphodiesterase
LDNFHNFQPTNEIKPKFDENHEYRVLLGLQILLTHFWKLFDWRGTFMGFIAYFNHNLPKIISGTLDRVWPGLRKLQLQFLFNNFSNNWAKRHIVIPRIKRDIVNWNLKISAHRKFWPCAGCKKKSRCKEYLE